MRRKEARRQGGRGGGGRGEAYVGLDERAVVCLLVVTERHNEHVPALYVHKYRPSAIDTRPLNHSGQPERISPSSGIASSLPINTQVHRMSQGNEA